MNYRFQDRLDHQYSQRSCPVEKGGRHRYKMKSV